MIARASSGSRSCASSVEPLMSANSAVTVLRSPSRFSGGDVSAIRICGSFDFLAVADWDVPSAAPHSPQNFSRDSFVAPHRGHFGARVSPHSAQNFRPSRLSVPHFEQRITPPLEPYRPTDATSSLCYASNGLRKSMGARRRDRGRLLGFQHLSATR